MVFFFYVAISGLPSLCSKSGERCNWTFYGATCKLLKGLTLILDCHIVITLLSISSNLKINLVFSSIEENLRNLAFGLVVQQPLARNCLEMEGQMHMTLHLIHCYHHLYAVYLFKILIVFRKMNFLVVMLLSLLM